MSETSPKMLEALPAPDELTCRRLLALLTGGGAADEHAA